MLLSRRGFYFSFDALMALTLMGVATIFLMSTSDPVRQSLDTTGSSYRETNNIAEDATQIAIRSTLRESFSDGHVQSYIDDTSLDAEDADKSVLDVISILWASNETETARNVTRAFFGDIMGSEFGYRLSLLDQQRNVIFNTSFVPADAEFAANAKRIVSGVARNQPSEGFLARARAEEVDKNTTEVFEIPMGGSSVKSGASHALEVNRSFTLDAAEITNGTLYLSLHTGGSDEASMDVNVNGQDAGFPNNWDYNVDKDGKKLLFHSKDITSLLRSGENFIYVNAKNTGGAGPTESVHVHPGARAEVEYRATGGGNLTNTVDETKYFPNILTHGHASDDHGVWSVMPYFIPENASVENVTLNLRALDVDGDTAIGDEEFQVYLNDEKLNVSQFCDTVVNELDCDMLPGEHNITAELDLTNKTRNGTNVIAVYFNTFLDSSGAINGFGDDDRIELYSDPLQFPDNSSRLTYSYTRGRSGLIFGKIDLSRTEELGGVRSNPKSFNHTFNQSSSLLSSFVHLATLDNENTTIQVKDENSGFRTAFESPRPFANPTDIFVDPSYYNTTMNATNTVNISDDCQVSCDILPETAFERRILIQSQVGYGDTFQNRSAAVTDARERLNKTLGEFVDATDIVSSALSVSNLPWLFGPVTVELEVWKP